MKFIKGLSIVLCLFLLAGCVQLVPAQQPTATEGIKALPPTGTPVDTSTPIIVIVTATPLPATATPVATDTPVATNTPVPTETFTPSPTAVPGITLNTLTDLGNGNINVTWSTTGTFANGFQVVWSATNSQPSFPQDSSTYVYDPGTTSTQISGEAGRTYYVRVCRYVNSSCDLYSNVQSITLSGTPITYTYPQYTQYNQYLQYNQQYNQYPQYNRNSQYYNYPRPQYYAYPTPSTSDTTPYAPYLYINMVLHAGSGSADLYWRSYGDFSKGYRLLYSTTDATLTYGDTLQYVITNGNTHMYTITGTNGVTYYYRICRFTGTTCDVYSNQVSYTFYK